MAGHRKISHGGGINGFLSQLSWYPDDELVVAVLSNSTSAEPAALEARIARAVLGAPEAEHAAVALEPEELARYAGGVLAAGAYPQWQLDYLALLVQRDLPNWGLPSRPQVTERLLRMLAASSGQTWNASKIGQSLGLTYHTVNRYTDYLAGAFLIRLLPPFEANVRKRITKRPKLHWRDSGLLHAVLQVVDHRTLLSQPWVGASWEGFVVDQTLGLLGALGQPHAGYHFRAGNQDEIDLVLEIDGEVWAIETKLTTSPSPRDVARLDRSAELIGASRRFLISQTPVPGGDDHRASHNLGSFSRWLVERFGGQRQGA